MKTVKPYRTSNIFHLVMTFFTCGLWLVIWILCILSASRKNKGLELALQQQNIVNQNRMIDSINQISKG